MNEQITEPDEDIQREDGAIPRMVGLRYDEYRKLKRIEEAAQVAYELLVYQKSDAPSLSQMTVDSVIKRLGKALGRR